MASKQTQEKKSSKTSQRQAEFQCQFCKKELTTEERLFNHICEPKRRYLQKDEPAVRIAYIAYVRFYEREMRTKERPTYEKFADSKLYTGFVRFGRHITNYQVINPNGFIEFVLNSSLPLKEWVNPVIYDTYVKELNKGEVPIEGMERNLKLIQQWAKDNNEIWTDFFKKVSTNQAVLWILCGKISPWILFLASSAPSLLERLSVEQQKMIERVIDIEFWKLKLEKHNDDVNHIRQILEEVGL